MEEKLEQVDSAETAKLFVRSSRYDKNVERSTVLSDINDALTDYGNRLFPSPLSDKEYDLSYLIPDKFLKRNFQVLRYERANVRDLVSLQNWLRGNACMTRDETAYLTYFDDLMSLSWSKDTAVAQLDAWVEVCLIKFYKNFRTVRFAPVLSAVELQYRL